MPVWCFVPDTVLINISFMEGSSSANDRISTCSDRVDSKVELLIPSALWICSSRIPLCSFRKAA